jgi:TRAP-type uncharacterized transport system fused permease subunit
MSDTSRAPEAGQVDDFIAEADTGARNPKGSFSRGVLWGVPLIWSLFQLWIASPIPYEVGFGVVNNAQARSIHLAFAVFLAFTAFPTLRSSPRDYIPFQDWAAALVAAFCAGYCSCSGTGWPTAPARHPRRMSGPP